ncbi:hypothetical protein GUJ93_ZPchr0002g25440 [Zizania palustris]|uniref:Uncharacterized protein n=1 Tax=Zizania palustris TaxID=103762 RepID=A0A8J5V3C0_ZIZPA|nr:hypothetical protein GUJ93_ZPchr0002g25440 [Zizania palustris]
MVSSATVLRSASRAFRQRRSSFNFMLQISAERRPGLLPPVEISPPRWYHSDHPVQKKSERTPPPNLLEGLKPILEKHGFENYSEDKKKDMMDMIAREQKQVDKMANTMDNIIDIMEAINEELVEMIELSR